MNAVKNIIIAAIFASLTIACGASTQGSIQPMEHGFQAMTDQSNFDTSFSKADEQVEVAQDDADKDVSTLRRSGSTVRPIVRRPVIEKPCHTAQCGFSVPSIERPSISFGFENKPVQPHPVMPTTNNAGFGAAQF